MPTKKSQQGFVLVATLWVMAIILVIAAAFDSHVSRKLDQAYMLRDRLQFNLDQYSTEQTLKYLLATSRYTQAGLVLKREAPASYTDREGHIIISPVGGELRLDGTVYKGLGSSCFALQDTAGLIALNAPSALDLRWLLKKHDGSTSRVDQLIDVLQDYRDKNELVRLNGAESTTYLRAGMPSPSSYHIRSPNELYRVYGWESWLQAHPDFKWWRWLSIKRSAMFNPNTVPASLLARLFGLSAADVERWLQLRESKPFVSRDDMAQRSGVKPVWPEEKYRFLASNKLQVHLWPQLSGQRSVIALEFTPSGLLGPWQQLYQYKMTTDRDPVLACETTESELFQKPRV